jgi:uncharacterized protein YbjT (DUF2867 family)
MKVFLAGATGVIGIRLVPLLRDAGHEVVGSTRSPAKAETLAVLGATPVVCDVYDRARLVDIVVDAAPDLVLHQLTDLPHVRDTAPEAFAGNARIRTEGTDNLVAAARAAGASHFVAQSIAWQASNPASVEHLERAVLEFGGIVLRYGQFHGPGTWYTDHLPEEPRVDIDRAAALTIDHLTSPTGIYTIID